MNVIYVEISHPGPVVILHFKTQSIPNSLLFTQKVSFFKYLFVFTRKADLQRGDTEGKILCPPVHSSSGHNDLQLSQSQARRQEILPGLPGGCRIPRCWSTLRCLPRPQVVNWMGSEAARIQTGTYMGSWQLQYENLTTEPSCRAPHRKFLLAE